MSEKLDSGKRRTNALEALLLLMITRKIARLSRCDLYSEFENMRDGFHAGIKCMYC